MELLQEFKLSSYLSHLVDTYPYIERIHYYFGAFQDIPLLILELVAGHSPSDLSKEKWVCEDFMDIYLLSRGEHWYNPCIHLKTPYFTHLKIKSLHVPTENH